MPDTKTTHQDGVINPAAGDTVVFDTETINNVNSQNRRSRISLLVKSMTPNQDTEPVGYKLRLVLEEKVNSDDWSVVVESPEWNQGFKNVHILEIRPGAVENEGQPQIRSGQSGQTIIMREDGFTPAEFRVRIIKREDDPAKPDLTSIDCVLTSTLFENTQAS